MNTTSPKKIVVVGGGSSGWMTGISLNKVFNASARNYDITVIESPDIGIIGVGEATVHSVRFFFAALGLDEDELLRETNASLKTGILFKNWRKPVNGHMHQYFHPFEHQPLGREQDISSSWFINGRERQERYDEGVSLSTALMKQGHGPKGPNSPSYQGVVPYGYHIDAVLLARYLRKKATEAGVRHIEATISDVEVAGDTILSVQAGDDRYEADVFIDCTGFRGLLIEKLKQDNWISFTKALPCNKAVAIQRELVPGEAPKPYTTSTAASNGWIWQIDLVNRQGTGYVYDGNRLSSGEAEAELRAFLGPESQVLKCTHLNMKIGCRKEFWVGNCIAIGLSGGFIEPLESTGLHLINLAAGLLASHHPRRDTTQAVRDSFNRLMSGFYQDLKQFIVLHYCLTDRDDSDFWRAAPATVKECPWLEKQLEIWRHKICEYQDLAGSFSTIFADENYRYVLYGMQHYPDLRLSMGPDSHDKISAQLAQMAVHAVNVTLPHGDYLRRLNEEQT
ncbi:tryptophan halogenase family protein [Paremcibacter congregatus]|uniref:tryptophan halogenase family protein n=1 Tax=Paremcibacter congregatus TaxID=2043170 RepID=UPI0030EBBC15|tara:strand:+ start:2859 stop:4382 length:1524 start_codon:yes stop_codon:yes gene_type:complete